MLRSWCVDLTPSAEGRSRRATHPRHWVSLQLESLEERVTPDTTITLVAGNATVTFSMFGQSAPIPVQVASPLGPVNVGTVEVALLVNGQPVAAATAGVTNGQATVMLPIPAGLPVGSYTLSEGYSVGPSVLASSPGTLAVTGGSSGSGSSSGSGAAGQSVIQAAIEVAIDTAAILLQGNFTAEQELQIASVMFLKQPLPSDLVSDLLAHIGPADGLAFPAIAAGIQFANSV